MICNVLYLITKDIYAISAFCLYFYDTMFLYHDVRLSADVTAHLRTKPDFLCHRLLLTQHHWKIITEEFRWGAGDSLYMP